MSARGVKVGNGHDHDVRPVRCPRTGYPSVWCVNELCDRRFGDTPDLAFGREDRLGDGPEDLCAITRFPVVEFVPDFFVDLPSELFELGGGVIGGGGSGTGK